MKKIPLHPIFFTLYVVLSLYANNAAQVPVERLVRPLLAMTLAAAGLYFLLDRIFKDRLYAAYLASWIVIWFSFFGHLFQAASLVPFFARLRGNDYFLLGGWTLAMGLLGMPGAWKRIRNKKLVNDVLTTISVVAAIFPLFTIAAAIYNNRRASALVADWRSSQPRIEIDTDADSPDIYYIILDGYGRPFRDPWSEWFPAITGRKSLATIFGYEWVNDGKFGERIRRYDSLQACARKNTDCLSEWERETRLEFAYLYLQLEDATLPLQLSLESSQEYALIYKTETAAIFARAK